ncbi:hypothetical protein [Paracoccus haeundaensis]|uniref:Uncharacterized protein n=1 Tax=Paracoccus haeundaensis TaxID=225362 RepID=A0A5C4RC39_9RHOB|nr:hypothetical protein [Paracoccus haeundaensis]TNH41264.1 hypothetical protein FHD67_00690 [Paracoccus haeundaensis]
MTNEQCARASRTFVPDVTRVISSDRPGEVSNTLAYRVSSLLRVARLALENDNSGWTTEEQTRGAVGDVLEIAEALQDIIVDGTEQMHRDLGTAVRKLEARA